MQTDSASIMAEFLLKRADQLVLTTALDSPLEAAASGNLSAAYSLADLYQPEYSSLWYILIAWQQFETNKPKEASDTLNRLLKKTLVRFSGWKSQDFISLFGSMVEVDSKAFKKISISLLEEDSYFDLCNYLVDRNNLDPALELAEEIQDPWVYADALRLITSAASYIPKEQADPIILSVLESSKKIADVGARSWLLGAVARVQASFGLDIQASKLFDDALTLINQSQDLSTLTTILWFLSSVKFEMGLKDDARKIFHQALDAASKIETLEERDNELAKLSVIPILEGNSQLSLDLAGSRIE